jgi:hypothetical protein
MEYKIKAPCFAFERSQVQILAWRPAILNEVFIGISQSLQAVTGIVRDIFL